MHLTKVVLKKKGRNDERTRSGWHQEKHSKMFWGNSTLVVQAIKDRFPQIWPWKYRRFLTIINRVCKLLSFFSKLYLLISHIQYDHINHVIKAEKKIYEHEEKYKIMSSISDAGDKRTREVPSLQKPFQCEACDKCFSDYNNMMSHVEHYHGWSRQCNVGTCQKRLSSIAEFVTHHVKHYDSTFTIPKNNSARNNCICICPVCKKISSGVNRHWEHSFIHNKVARFKCPLCDRRVNKVQNLKDHNKRHMGPASRKKVWRLWRLWKNVLSCWYIQA